MQISIDISINMKIMKIFAPLLCFNNTHSDHLDHSRQMAPTHKKENSIYINKNTIGDTLSVFLSQLYVAPQWILNKYKPK